jgi:hypothetical protein
MRYSGIQALPGVFDRAAEPQKPVSRQSLTSDKNLSGLDKSANLSLFAHDFNRGETGAVVFRLL